MADDCTCGAIEFGDMAQHLIPCPLAADKTPDVGVRPVVEGERERLSAVLGHHRPVEDSRGDVVRCACGVHFGVQHQANGSHPMHQAAVLADWLAAHDARVLEEAQGEIARLREAVNREHGEPIDEVYTVDGLAIVMGTIHALRTERDRLTAGVRHLLNGAFGVAVPGARTRDHNGAHDVVLADDLRDLLDSSARGVDGEGS